MTPEQVQKLIGLAEKRNYFLSQIAWCTTIGAGALVIICTVILHRLP